METSEVDLWIKLGNDHRFICGMTAIQSPFGWNVVLQGDQLLTLVDLASEALTWKEEDAADNGTGDS